MVYKGLLSNKEYHMYKVRISPAIANEYVDRCVYDFIGSAGTYKLTRKQATELLADAKYFVFDTDMTPPGIVRAYSALASNLMAALGDVA
jgi:hypothetical protein